jgi:DNA repair protein RadC
MPDNRSSALIKNKMIRFFAENSFSLSNCSLDKTLEILLCCCLSDSSKAFNAARLLLCRCGSLREILRLPPEQLSSACNISCNEAVRLKLAAAFMSRLMLGRCSPAINIFDENAVEEYLKALFFCESSEKVYMLTLDSRQNIRSTFLLAEGAVNSVNICFAEISRLIKEHGCRRFALVHNHPFTSSQPTSVDITSTLHIFGLAMESGAELSAHYIIGDDGISLVPTESNYVEYFFAKS